jgi:superfamily II RNA helicase
MDFHADFVLKALHAASVSTPLDWMTSLRGTYWYQEYRRQEADLDKRLQRIRHQQASHPKMEPYWSDTIRCRELEQRIRQTVNAERKALQRQLDTLRNRQLGPQWKKTAEEVQRYETLQREEEKILEAREVLGTPLTRVEQSVGFLTACGYLEQTEQGERLTQKGILATEVNEGHPLLLTEFYVSGHGRAFTDLEWVLFLSVFLEHREDQEETGEVSGTLQHALLAMEETVRHFQEEEASWCPERTLGWSSTWIWMDPMRDWYEGSSSATIAEQYGIFEGNFYRSLLKLINLVNEVISMATYCEHVEQVDQLSRVSEQLRRSQWMGESLYLRL